MPNPSLRQFILRQQALSLYRDLLRASHGLKGDQQKDMKVWIRGEFDKWRDTTNEDTIKLLLTQGRQTLREIRTSIEITK